MLIWTLFPSHTGQAGVAAPYEEWIAAVDRGWVKIEGCRAIVTDEAYLHFKGWIRFRIIFDEPYPHPHP